MKIIKDLTTVKEGLESGYYSEDLDLFAQHMRLIWSNCMLYNQEKSDFYKRAKRFERTFDKDLSKALNPKGKGRAGGSAAKTDRPNGGGGRNPTLDDKANFCDKLRELSEVNLGKLIHSLDEHCERALIKHNPDEVEINIDAIDMQNFRKHEALVKQLLLDERREQGAENETSAANASGAASNGGSNKRPMDGGAESGRSTKRSRTEPTGGS